MTAKAVPTCIHKSNATPGSFQFRKRGIRARWPLELTGKNSVTPWINPYKNAENISI